MGRKEEALSLLEVAGVASEGVGACRPLFSPPKPLLWAGWLLAEWTLATMA